MAVHREHRIGRRHHRELRHRLLLLQVGPRRTLAIRAYIYADWGIRCNVIQPGERSHHMLSLMKKKEEVQEFLKHFR